jgi:hypothetical protein
MLSKYRNLFRDWEKLAFYTVVIVFTLQFSLNETLITYDGPSHVYNAGIIKEKIFSGNSFYDIFQFNSTPNWSTHFILALFQVFLSPDFAERLFLFILIVLFAFSFRNLILSWFPRAWHMAWLSALFAFNFLFYFGFYNFIFGIIIGFILLKKREKLNNGKVLLVLYYSALWFILAYTHAFVFLLIMGISFWEFTLILCRWKFKFLNHSETFEDRSVGFSRVPEIHISLIKFLTAALPSVVILFYLLKPLDNRGFVFLSGAEIFDLFKYIRPLVVFNSEIEGKRLFPVFILIIGLSLFFLIRNAYFKRKERSLFKQESFNLLFWLPVFSGSLFLAFRVPDSDGYVGFVSLRMVFIVFIFGSLLISIIRFPVWAKLTLVCFLTYSTSKLQNYRTTQLNYLESYVKSLKEAGKLINKESYTLLYTLENHWFLRHAGMIAFHDNLSVSLDNYEAEYPLFPISWRNSKLPDLRVGEVHSGELNCFKWESNKEGPDKIVDYVLLFGHEDQIQDLCELEMWQNIKQYYTLVYEDDHVVLMALRRESALIGLDEEGEEWSFIPY